MGVVVFGESCCRVSRNNVRFVDIMYLLILGLYNDSWIILAAASILWVRILWQFRFHRKTDGRLILMLLLDNPVIALGNENDADFTYEKDVLIWKVFQVIGVLVEIAVVVFWGIPFVLSIYTNLFV